MQKHPLLKHATRRPYSETPQMSDDAIYDRKSGYWRVGDQPLSQTELRKQATKKEDQETGEDLKGE